MLSETVNENSKNLHPSVTFIQFKRSGKIWKAVRPDLLELAGQKSQAQVLNCDLPRSSRYINVHVKVAFT